MSFFSGFMLGQTMSGRGNSGGAALGLFGLFAVAFVLVVIAATLGSFLLPLYSIMHFSLWAYAYWDEFGATCAAIVMLMIVPPAYAMALLGTRKEFYFCGGFLALLAFVVVYSLSAFSGTPLHAIEELTADGEYIANALMAAALCVASVFGFRFLLVKFASVERRIRMVRTTQKPIKWLVTSRLMAWATCATALLFTVGSAVMILSDHKRIYRFMEDTGRSYDDGFAFVYYGSKYQEDMAVLCVSAVIMILAAVHIFHLRRRKHKSVSANIGQPQAAR